MHGIFLVDKPKTWTSFDVVNYVRRIVAQTQATKPKNTKVGHSGTLDPLATGLLVLLVGKQYTRRAGELTKLDKTYEVTMKLGEVSTTGDDEGEKTAVTVAEQPSRDAVDAALQSFLGETMQVPPMYSAVKIDGKRAYKLAREGKTVAIEPRQITIDAITLTSYEYPYIQFTASVSSGTYIRSLVEDIAKKLGTGAYMTDLRRTRIGDFQLADAYMNLTELTAETLEPRLLQLPDPSDTESGQSDQETASASKSDQ